MASTRAANQEGIPIVQHANRLLDRNESQVDFSNQHDA